MNSRDTPRATPVATVTWTPIACVDRPVPTRWSSRERHTHCADQTRSWCNHTVGSVPRKTHLIKTEQVYTGKWDSTSQSSLELLPECPRLFICSRSLSQMINTEHGSPEDSECTLGKYHLNKSPPRNAPRSSSSKVMSFHGHLK